MVVTLLVTTMAVREITLLHRPLPEIEMMPPLGASNRQTMAIPARREMIHLTTMTVVFTVVQVVVEAAEAEVIGDSSRNWPLCCEDLAALVVGAARGDGDLVVPALVHLDQTTIGKRLSRSTYCLFHHRPHLKRG